MNEQLEALEAAKLAAMVGGQLKQVDKLKVDGHQNPANKININNFIATVKDPRFKPSNPYYNTPSGFAPPPPEELIQRMVPDVAPSFPQPQTNQQQSLANIPIPPPAIPPTQETSSVSIQKQINQKTISENISLNEKNIAESLEKISNTLENMLLLLNKKFKDE